MSHTHKIFKEIFCDYILQSSDFLKILGKDYVATPSTFSLESTFLMTNLLILALIFLHCG